MVRSKGAGGRDYMNRSCKKTKSVKSMVFNITFSTGKCIKTYIKVTNKLPIFIVEESHCFCSLKHSEKSLNILHLNSE